MGQLTYSDRASELFTIRTQHQALTLGTKRASALGAATLERETRNAEKEQHYQHLPSLAAIHNLISTAVSDTNAAQPITHNICRFSDLQRRVLHSRLPQIIRDLCPNHHGTLPQRSRSIKQNRLASKDTRRFSFTHWVTENNGP